MVFGREGFFSDRTSFMLEREIETVKREKERMRRETEIRKREKQRQRYRDAKTERHTERVSPITNWPKDHPCLSVS